MGSWRACIWMSLTFMCGLATRTSTASTCTISGQETRVNRSTFFDNNTRSCNLTTKCFKKELSLTGQHGTLEYSCRERNENLTLLLDNITSSTDYEKIHLLTCKNMTSEWKWKLRFGQNIADGEFTTVFEYFQNYSFKQKCHCKFCRSNSCSDDLCPTFFCNCKFSNYSIETAVLFSEPHTTTTTTTTTTWPQTTTAPRTETITHSITTHIPATSEPTSTTDDSTSTKIARQSNEESISTLAAVGGLIALVVIVSGVTVYVCLRRRKWNKKQSDYSEPCVTNPSYEDLQEHGTNTGQDNAGYEGNGNDVHTYDMADDQKLTTTGEQDYSYASFGGQSKFQDVMPIVNHDRYVGGRKDGLCHESPPTVQGNTGNAKFLIERDVTSENDDDYDLAKAVTGDKAINSNSTTLPENYFNVEKTGHQPPPLRNNSNDNYFVLENDANERVEAMQTMKESFSPEGGNYFLVDESENAPSNEKSFTKETPANSKTGNGDITGIQGDNYFLLEQQPNSEENNLENGVYALAQSQSQSQTENGYGISRKSEQKQMKTDRDNDPYDHVRVGHAQTNGIDEGDYDELRKQNVRYESEEVDNDYDRCPATGHL